SPPHQNQVRCLSLNPQPFPRFPKPRLQLFLLLPSHQLLSQLCQLVIILQLLNLNLTSLASFADILMSLHICLAIVKSSATRIARDSPFVMWRSIQQTFGKLFLNIAHHLPTTSSSKLRSE